MGPKKEGVKAVVSVPPTPAPGALSGSDYALGVGLGVAPLIVIPALIISAITSGIKKPKPLPTPPPPKVKPFDKPLSESASEGIADLFSGNVDDVTKTNINLIIGGFGVAALGLVLNSFTVKVPNVPSNPNPPPVVKKVEAPKPAPAPKVDDTAGKEAAAKEAAAKEAAAKVAAGKEAAAKEAAAKEAAAKE